MARIATATTPDDFELGRRLWREWADLIDDPTWLPGIEADLADIDRIFGPPSGALLLAWEGQELAGGGALKRIDDELCEMTRVMVRSQFRGKGLARALSVALLGEARRLGYRAIRFGIPATLAGKMAIGAKLYESLGFRRILPYGGHPADAVCMEARVRAAARR